MRQSHGLAHVGTSCALPVHLIGMTSRRPPCSETEQRRQEARRLIRESNLRAGVVVCQLGKEELGPQAVFSVSNDHLCAFALRTGNIEDAAVTENGQLAYSVLHVPPVGFAHRLVAIAPANRGEKMAAYRKRTTPLLASIERYLEQEDRQPSEFGEFWRVEAVARILAEIGYRN